MLQHMIFYGQKPVLINWDESFITVAEIRMTSGSTSRNNIRAVPISLKLIPSLFERLSIQVNEAWTYLGAYFQYLSR